MALTFDLVPYTFTQTPNLFRDLWSKAASQTVRGFVFGDSQETSSGGAGVDYAVHLNYQFFLRYRNAPESTLVTGNFGTHGTDARWLNNASSSGMSPTRLTAAETLPEVISKTTNGIGDIYYGGLLHRNEGAGDPQIRYGEYFKLGAGPYLEVYLATSPGSGTVGVYQKVATNWAHDKSGGALLEGGIDAGQDAAAGSFVSHRTANKLLVPGNGEWLKATIYKDGGTADPEVVGMRFISSEDPSGVVVDFYGSGGKTAASWLSTYADSGPMLKVFSYDFGILHFGANETNGSGVTPEQYKLDVEALISLVRSATNNSTFPVILIADVFREISDATSQGRFDQYPGVLKEIADADPYVMAVNARRIMEELGFNATYEDNPNITDLGEYNAATAYVVDDVVYTRRYASAGTGTRDNWRCREATTGNDPPNNRYWEPYQRLLADGVHYSNEGARRLAEAEVNAIMGLPGLAPPAITVGAIGRQGRFQGELGRTHYLIVGRMNGATAQVWDDVAVAWVDESSAVWADVAIGVAETLVDSARFRAVVPVGVPAGLVHLTAYAQQAVAPKASDTPIAEGDWYWDGSSLLTLEAVDGVSDLSVREAMLAYIAGESTVVDHGDGTKTITYTKQDGVTAKLAITFDTNGQFTGTQVS